jgi:hypothetical protein
MRRKSVLLLAASWLVVRLRLALFSSRAALHDLLHAPQVLLVTRRQDPHRAGEWFSDGARLHFIHHHEPEQRLHVRSFPAFEKN